MSKVPIKFAPNTKRNHSFFHILPCWVSRCMSSVTGQRPTKPFQKQELKFLQNLVSRKTHFWAMSGQVVKFMRSTPRVVPQTVWLSKFSMRFSLPASLNLFQSYLASLPTGLRSCVHLLRGLSHISS